MDSQGKETANDEIICLFLGLPNKEQTCALQECLIQEDPVVFHPSLEPLVLNKRIAPGITLLQRLALYQGESKLDLMCQAREMFYGRNEFLIWWHGLEDFLSGFPIGGAENSSVGLIVRNVTVRYDMRDGEKYGRDLVTELEKLFRFGSADHLTLEIIGGGTAEGSDLETQRLIEDVCSIVERLIAQFGRRFNIQKGSGIWTLLPSLETYCLTSYWDAPPPLTRAKVDRSEATFQEFMQVQVESWLGKNSPMLFDESSNEPKDGGLAGLWDASQDAFHTLFGDTEDWLLRECLLFQGCVLPQECIFPQECILPQESLPWEALL